MKQQQHGNGMVSLLLMIQILILILSQSVTASERIFDVDPDQLVEVPGLIESRGFKAEEHSVQTNDGYILTIHRIVDRELSPKTRTNLKPLLLFHGLMGSSADFLMNSPFLTTNESKYGDTVGFALTQTKRYDVWLLNARGNRYSQGHYNLSTNDPEYWNFSWEQMALEDLPSSIDYVKNYTNSSTIGYIGHSQGSLTMFVLLSYQPKYADVIQPFIALAPTVFYGHIQGPFRLFASFGPALKLIGGEFIFSNAISGLLAEKFCTIELMKNLCKNTVFLLLGFDSKNFNETRMSVITHFLPSPTSSWNLAHYSQLVLNKRCSRFDYGLIENQKQYGQTTAPDIPLENIPKHTKIALFQGVNDLLGDQRDIQRLKNQLNDNGIELIRDYYIPDPDWAHMDFVWGKNSGKLFINEMIDVLDQFTTK